MSEFSGNLQGKTVFVAGGSGNIGGMAVRGCLRAGATVVTASRDLSRFDRLKRFLEDDDLDLDNLVTLEGNVSDLEEAQKLFENVKDAAGVPYGVITSIGGMMEPKALLKLPLDTWHSVLNSNLTSHLLTAQAFLPAMLERNSGAYYLISGYGAYGAWAKGAPVAIAAGGVISLGRNLAAENDNAKVRIGTMVLATGLQLWDELGEQDGSFKGDDVGDFLGWLLSKDGDDVSESVLHFVTEWEKANAMRHF